MVRSPRELTYLKEKIWNERFPYVLLYLDEKDWYDILPFDSKETMEKFVADHTQPELTQK